MAESSLKEKLQKIFEELKTPPKLSEVEKDKISKTFEAMKEVLDDTLEIVLEMDRGEAFRYTNILVTAIQEADANFMGGVELETPIIAIAAPTGPVPRPDFAALRENLTEEQLAIGLRSLDCFQQFDEVGDDIVCPDCSMEKMFACIRREDPSVDPKRDFIDHPP